MKPTTVKTPATATAEETVENLDWALAYAAAGFAVMPVWWRVPDGEGWTCACPKGSACDRPAKHPIPKQGVKQATKDPDRLRVWWEEHPLANVGMATGEQSACIVIDVDVGSGNEGDISITTACAEKGGVPRTLKATSGSGGRHYFYRWRPNPYTRKIGFLKHVDYLADGGYVIVQPSCNLKGAYLWDPEVSSGAPEVAVGRLRAEMAELPEWFDALEGTGRAGRKAGGKERADAALKRRMVNAAAMEFNPDKPEWLDLLKDALAECDPDSRDDWVLFGIILGRECQRNDDGWRIYNEWASRSAKYNDRGTQKAMRGYYYDDSTVLPQGGEPASIATIFRRAQDGGFVFPAGGADRRRAISYREGRGVETAQLVLTLLARERESDADQPLRVYAYGSGLGGIVETHDFGVRYDEAGRPPNGWVLKVSPHNPMSIGTRITHTCTVMNMSPTGSQRQIECPREVSSLMLSDYVKHFPRLNGIVQWPMVMGRRVVGLDEPYDSRAGLFFALPEGLDLQGVQGTRKEAEEAWAWVRGTALQDFPFASPRDEVAALAMLLTFMQRRGMDAAPAFLVTAPIQGSGKTSLVRFASRAVHGRAVAARPFSGVNEEIRKTITSALLANPPCLLFDNLPAGSTFTSAELAIAMTSGEWEDRKLGFADTVTLPNRAVWCFTGNNVSVKADLKRRFVTIRFVPKQRDHHTQLFPRNIDTWPIENRAAVLKALCSIALWGAKQLTTQLTTESGYKDWDREVRGVVVALTGLDPFLTAVEQHDAEHEDEDSEAEVALMVGWAMFCGGERRTVSEFAERVHDAAKSSDPAKRRAAEAVPGAVAVLCGKPLARLENRDWGQALRSMKEKAVPFDDAEARFNTDGMRSKVAVWVLAGWKSVLKSVGEEF